MRDEQKEKDDLISRRRVLRECNTEMDDSRNSTEEKAVAWRIAAKIREMHGQGENAAHVVKERYEDLCEFFDNNEDSVKSILQNGEEFRKWLRHMHWYAKEYDKIAQKLDTLKKEEQRSITRH